MSPQTKTFSDLWYRVADLTPRLSAHLSVRRHTYRGETWFILGDPASSKFYRFNASAYRFLGLLDGRRSVQEAWEVCVAQLGDDAPTQQQCIDLLAQLQSFGLIRGDLPLDAQRLRERHELLREQKIKEFTGNYVFYTVPLFNPERLLQKFANVARVVFSGKGLIGLAILMFFALRSLAGRWDDLGSSLNHVIDVDNLILLGLAFALLKVAHELAHGYACKAYGGRVTEIGIMFMIVLPIPYCDATSSWSFPNKWHRILVSAAGMMVELAIACVAAIVWANTEPGTVHALAYNIMFAASLATVIFNLNPLLRYDGYYMLADVLEIPNLAQRSHTLLKWLARRFLFGLKGEDPPPLHSKTEGFWMVLHAICAFPYRMMVIIGIVLIVAQKYFVVGLVLALFGGVMWFCVPVIKMLAYVISDPKIQVVRPRAIAVTFGGIIALILLIAVVPMPSRIYATAVVEPAQYATIRAPFDGMLVDLNVEHGEEVPAGTRLFTLYNPQLESQYQRALHGVELERIRLDATAARAPVERSYATRMYDTALNRKQTIEKILEDRHEVAEFTGYFVAAEIEAREGTWFRMGEQIGLLTTNRDLILRAYVADEDYAWLRRHGNIPDARAKMRGRPGEMYDVTVARVAGGAGEYIRNPALGQGVEGGDVATDVTDSSGMRTLDPQWEMVLAFQEDPQQARARGSAPLLPGTRAKVRFDLDPEPLVRQWARRLQQFFAGSLAT